MRHLALVLGVMLCPLAAAPGASAQDVPAAKIDAVFKQYDQPASPGCALGVMKDDRLIYARGYGLANLEHLVPITPQTVFDIGSTSKQFTATAIILLAQQGKLSLDDDIRKYVPEVPAYARPITIRHLLTHTSGLRDYLTLMSLAGIDFDGVTTDEDALDLIVRQKATNFAPGDEHLYSNTGFFLLSVIVRRVSGISLAKFAEQNVFGPLGMTHTHVHDDHTLIVPLRATGYAGKDGGGFRIDMSGFEQTGDGAVMTTVEDLLRWDQNFYKPRVGGEDLLRKLHTTATLSNGKAITYALGLRVDTYRGLKLVSHGGSWAGYRADLLRFPDEHLSVACLCNLSSSNPTRLAQQVADLYLAAKLAPAKVAPQPPGPPRKDAITSTPALGADKLREFAGSYYAEELGVTYTLVVDGEALRIRGRNLPNAPLKNSAQDAFTADGRTLEFRRDASGRITGFAVQAGRIRNVWFERRD